MVTTMAAICFRSAYVHVLAEPSVRWRGCWSGRYFGRVGLRPAMGSPPYRYGVSCHSSDPGSAE